MWLNMVKKPHSKQYKMARIWTKIPNFYAQKFNKNVPRCSDGKK